MNNQKSNGNSQLNEARESLNDRVNKKAFLGKTIRNAWSSMRRFRSI